jgi:GAF domain-containing protein
MNRRVPARDGDTGRLLHELLQGSLRTVGVDGAGASLVTVAGKRDPVYGSDDIAVALEQLQLTLGEGPCVDAASSLAPVLVPDIDDLRGGYIGRWPAFAAEARTTGVRAVFAFPLRIGAIAFGAVDLYRLAPGGLSDDQLGAALTTTDAAALAVLDLRALYESDGEAADAVGSMVAHQAAGRIMVQLDCTIEEVFVRLRAASYAEGVPLDALALDVAEGRRRFEDEG